MYLMILLLNGSKSLENLTYPFDLKSLVVDNEILMFSNRIISRKQKYKTEYGRPIWPAAAFIEQKSIVKSRKIRKRCKLVKLFNKNSYPCESSFLIRHINESRKDCFTSIIKR